MMKKFKKDYGITLVSLIRGKNVKCFGKYLQR